jgi:hypothetical protein
MSVKSTIALLLCSCALIQAEHVSICSFNIQFLGMSTKRMDGALVDLIKSNDVVVVQELVAPPYPGQFPDGKAFRPDREAARFFDTMRAAGFEFWLSEEDTGPGKKNHLNSSATEWFVIFFRPEKCKPAMDLPSGFLASDRAHHPDFDRVPYAFPLRTANGRLDFVLVSVHLNPGGASQSRKRRMHELAAIYSWIQSRSTTEKDFLVLGDMNIEDAQELAAILPTGWASLNERCEFTNTLITGPKPYDHVIYAVATTRHEIDRTLGFQIINLITEMRQPWRRQFRKLPYPGNPYNHDQFRARFSDHHPVVFRMKLPAVDDD